MHCIPLYNELRNCLQDASAYGAFTLQYRLNSCLGECFDIQYSMAEQHRSLCEHSNSNMVSRLVLDLECLLVWRQQDETEEATAVAWWSHQRYLYLLQVLVNCTAAAITSCTCTHTVSRCSCRQWRRPCGRVRR